MGIRNLDPFLGSRNKGSKAVQFLGLVQAGATQAIKRGEICTWDKTVGYFVPVSAVADHRYTLAIPIEEQKAKGRGQLTAKRYIPFYALSPDDIFQFQLDAAAALTLGQQYTLSSTDSQHLTAGAGDFAVAIAADTDHYPQEEDTVIRTQLWARVIFNQSCTYFGYRMSLLARAGRRSIAINTNEVLKESDMYNMIAVITGTRTITLPPVKPGMDIIFVTGDGNAQSIDPDGADQLRLNGALLAAGNKATNNSGAGDTLHLMTEGASGFLAITLQGTFTDGGG